MYAYNKFTSSHEIKENIIFVATTFPLPETTYYVSSGQIATLLKTLKVVHNETNNSTEESYPKNLSGPIHHSQNTLLQTSIAVLFGIIL